MRDLAAPRANREAIVGTPSNRIRRHRASHWIRLRLLKSGARATRKSRRQFFWRRLLSFNVPLFRHDDRFINGVRPPFTFILQKPVVTDHVIDIE